MRERSQRYFFSRDRAFGRKLRVPETPPADDNNNKYSPTESPGIEFHDTESPLCRAERASSYLFGESLAFREANL